jgi:hypothetical protein
VSVVTRSRLGFLIATVVLVTIVGKAALTEIQALAHHGAVICIGVGVAGFFSWSVGRWAEARRGRLSESQDAPSEQSALLDQGAILEQTAIEHPLAFLWSCKYWGIILILSGAMLTFIVTYPHPEPVRIVHARPLVTKTNTITITVTNVVTITNERPVVTFPPLKLAGLVVNGTKSTALINGRVLQVGEKIGDIELVAVDAEHATVALENQTEVLAMQKQSQLGKALGAELHFMKKGLQQR